LKDLAWYNRHHQSGGEPSKEDDDVRKKINHYSFRFKFQVVMDVLKGKKTTGQIARSRSIHPVSIHVGKVNSLRKDRRYFSRTKLLMSMEKGFKR